MKPDQQSAEAPDRLTGRECDFCHQVVPTVRRVALHGDYERLRTPHAVQYACPTCFEEKDRARLGLPRGSGLP